MRWAQPGADSDVSVVLDSLAGLQGVYTETGSGWDSNGGGTGPKLFNNDSRRGSSADSVGEFTTPVARANYVVQVTWHYSSFYCDEVVIEVEDANGTVVEHVVNHGGSQR